MSNFSTRARSADVKPSSCVDDQNSQGGWWYGNCHEFNCNLNGLYITKARMESSLLPGLQCQEQITGSEMKMSRKGVKAGLRELVTQGGDYENQTNQGENQNDQGDQGGDGQGNQGSDQSDQGENNGDQGSDQGDNQGENQQGDQGSEGDQGENEQ